MYEKVALEAVDFSPSLNFGSSGIPLFSQFSEK